MKKGKNGRIKGKGGAKARRGTRAPRRWKGESAVLLFSDQLGILMFVRELVKELVIRLMACLDPEGIGRARWEDIESDLDDLKDCARRMKGADEAGRKLLASATCRTDPQ